MVVRSVRVLISCVSFSHLGPALWYEAHLTTLTLLLSSSTLANHFLVADVLGNSRCGCCAWALAAWAASC